jgi:hypothetical protein
MMGMHANNDHAGLEATWRGELRAELLPRPHRSSDNTSSFLHTWVNLFYVLFRI